MWVTLRHTYSGSSQCSTTSDRGVTCRWSSRFGIELDWAASIVHLGILRLHAGERRVGAGKFANVDFLETEPFGTDSGYVPVQGLVGLLFV